MYLDNDITGDVLIALNHDLLKEMGLVSAGRRLKLLKLIMELKYPMTTQSLASKVSENQVFGKGNKKREGEEEKNVYSQCSYYFRYHLYRFRIVH
jgi:hypothetical protein